MNRFSKTTHEVTRLFTLSFINEIWRIQNETSIDDKLMARLLQDSLGETYTALLPKSDAEKESLHKECIALFNETYFDGRFKPAMYSKNSMTAANDKNYLYKQAGLTPHKVIIEGDLGNAEFLRHRVTEKNITLMEVDDQDAAVDRLIVGHTHLMLSPGLLATEYQASLPWEEENEALILFDVSINDEEGSTIHLCPSAFADDEHISEACGFFHALGMQTFIMQDRPALLLARLFSHLINVLSDYSLTHHLDPISIDQYLQDDLGLEYLPYQICDYLGPDYISAVTENLARTYQDGRYRNALLTRLKVNAQAYFRE